MSFEFIPLIAAACAFLTFALAVIGVLQLVRGGSGKKAYLQKVQGESNAAFQVQPVSLDEPDKGGLKNRLLGLLGLLGRSVAKEKAADYSDLRPKFLKAGIRFEKAPAVYWGAKAVFAVGLPLCFVLFRIIAPHVIISQPMSIAIVSVLAMAGFYLPDLWLSNRIQKRRQTILDGFPDALDLLVVCVEAGMGLDSAINRVARESRTNNQTLSEELHIFSLEIRAGMPRKEALKNLAMRTDLQEMQNLVTLLIQTEKFGTSVSQALKVFSDTMRTQRFQRAEEKGAKIPIKLLFPLILFIFPALFVAILGPAIIRIYQTLIQM